MSIRATAEAVAFCIRKDSSRQCAGIERRDPVRTEFRRIFGQIVDGLVCLWYYNREHINNGVSVVFGRKRSMSKDVNRRAASALCLHMAKMVRMNAESGVRFVICIQAGQ